MSVEEDIGEMKSDIKWIKEHLKEIRQRTEKNRGYIIGLLGAFMISVSSVIITFMR